MIDKFGTKNYVVNLGHGLWPTHTPENVKCFINEVHEYSKNKIAKL